MHFGKDGTEQHFPSRFVTSIFAMGNRSCPIPSAPKFSRPVLSFFSNGTLFPSELCYGRDARIFSGVRICWEPFVLSKTQLTKYVRVLQGIIIIPMCQGYPE